MLLATIVKLINCLVQNSSSKNKNNMKLGLEIYFKKQYVLNYSVKQRKY